MSLFSVFNVSGSALNAETIRLNTTASNLANAESVNGDSTKIYRARHPVFQAMMDTSDPFAEEQNASGVRIMGVVESTQAPLKRYAPENPLANKEGYVFTSNVNSIEEMTNMISANRSFATNVEAINTARDLLLKTISMGHYRLSLDIFMVNSTTATNPTTGIGTGTANTGVSGTGSSSSTSNSAATAAGVNGAATLGGTNFLTLMLAQLKNQDPTSPVDSNTFLTQLAQLSEVQGINTLNTSFSSLSSSMTSAQTLQASSLLGHQALVTTSTATTATAGATVKGAVTVPQTTSDVTLQITNAAKQVVKTIDLGAQSAGNASFTWDGTTSTGTAAPAGTYTLTATYGGQTQTSTAATTAVSGVVDSVSMGAAGTGAMTLNVAGVGSVAISALQQISN